MGNTFLKNAWFGVSRPKSRPFLIYKTTIVNANANELVTFDFSEGVHMGDEKA